MRRLRYLPTGDIAARGGEWRYADTITQTNVDSGGAGAAGPGAFFAGEEPDAVDRPSGTLGGGSWRAAFH